MKYDYKAVEAKWQKVWEDEKTFHVEIDHKKPKFYALVEFPYPSGAGLHVGHPRSYTALDVVSRKRRQNGYNVLYPMGWDAFGLPTENFAMKNHIHPAIVTKKNVDHFREQLKALGFSFDWDREINTTDPEYYKWTQWIFLQLYKHGLAYKKEMNVNWCTGCKCVLANEEVVNGVCERCGSEVVHRVKSQWMLKITAYADKLIDGLDGLDYIERVATQQKNWIGRSHGAEVNFGTTVGDTLTVYTTRCDTLFGATYMVVSPEHAMVKEWLEKGLLKNADAVTAYQAEAARKSDFERSELNKEKTGVVIEGVQAINPVNGKQVPVFIGDFVLASYGTGAVMAVPSHDQRDFEYAQVHNIPMIQVIDGADVSEHAFEKQDYLGKGCRLINSEEFTGLTVEEAKEAITCKLEKAGVARRKVNYHFREWIFARQRYWGEPVPCVYTDDGKTYFLPDDELPLILPELEDYKGRNGQAPLENATEWKKYDRNGIHGVRETSTMPGSAGSSWYYFRYIDPKNDKVFCDPELAKHWMPVDLYVGGPEHAVGHLMYSRIWNRFLYDQGLSPVKEPFKKLVHQGMILGENGIKMGKRFPEFVVNPSDVVREYGADTLRLYEMFMGPLEVSKPWSTTGVVGAKKFINRVWNFFTEEKNITNTDDGKLTKIYHQTVKKVTSDFEALGFNTAIAQMMVFVNEVYKNGSCPKAYAEGFIKMLSCITPHVGEEIWQLLGHDDTIAYESWPTYSEEKCKDAEVNIAVQVNGKMRGTVLMDADLSNEEVVANAVADEKIAKFLQKQGGQIVKTIVVKNKLVNLIVK